MEKVGPFHPGAPQTSTRATLALKLRVPEANDARPADPTIGPRAGNPPPPSRATFSIFDSSSNRAAHASLNCSVKVPAHRESVINGIPREVSQCILLWIGRGAQNSTTYNPPNPSSPRDDSFDVPSLLDRQHLPLWPFSRLERCRE